MRSILLVALVASLAGASEASARSPWAGTEHGASSRPSGLLDSGTLVVVIPTADGTVIAADSRGTLSDGSTIDTEQKIVRSSDLPVAAFVTGVAAGSLNGRPRAPRTRMDFDVSAVLRRELGQLDHIPSYDDFRGIVDTVAEAIRRSRNESAGKLRNQLTFIGLVTFRREISKTIIYTGRIGTDAADNVTVDIFPFREVDDGNAFYAGVYGESGYAMTRVLSGAGRALLSPETRRLLNARGVTVGALKGSTAYAAAKDIIETVGRSMVDDQKVPVTVGGPTRGVLVGPYGVSVLDGGGF